MKLKVLIPRVLLAITTLSMTACGIALNHPLTLGDWTGIITDVPSPPFRSDTAAFAFGAPKTDTGWFDSSMGVGVNCGAPQSSALTLTRDGNNFTLTGPDGYEGSDVVITGTIEGITAGGTVTFSNYCGLSWTGFFTANLTQGTQQPN